MALTNILHPMLFTRLAFLLFTLIILLMPSLAKAQIEANSKDKIRLDENAGEIEFENSDYRALIGSQYINRFSEFSDKLEGAEHQLDLTQRRIERKKRQFSAANIKTTKENLKKEIKELQTAEKKYNDKIKLIKKGLRLLQTNKSKSDPIKLSVLNQVNEIENQVLLMQNKYEDKEKENILSSISIENRDTYMNPLPKDCRLIYDGPDANSKKQRKEVEKEFFFGYTNPKLKPYFKDKHFLECEAKMVQLNKKNFLWLYITISSKDAVKNYGYIERNSPLKIELLDGNILYAVNAQNSKGTLEAYTGHTNYLIMLPLDKSKLKQLQKSEIDKIGIMWTSGYEQYEVYNVDLVMNQIDCIKNN